MFAKVEKPENYYEILEISEKVTQEEIKKAYKKLALKFHPDRAPLNNITAEQGEILFKKLNEAYETLNDPYKRSNYDLLLNIKNTRQGGYEIPDFYPNNYASSFWNQMPRSNKNPSSPEPTQTNNNEAPSPTPTNINRKEINDLIQKDEAKELHSYLMKYNFSSQSLLKILLSFATQQGSLSVVKYLVEERRINPKFIVTESFFQGSIFKYAAVSGNLDLVKYLLEEHDADIESQATTYPGCRGTALSYAAEKGHFHIVEYLIIKGANLNPEVADTNLLNIAISSGKISIVKLLVESGTTLDDYHLGHAFRKGNIAIVQYILEKKPGILNHRFLGNPASLVIESGNLDLLKYLEKYEGLDIFTPDKYIKDINILLLSAAARSENVEMMRYILNEKGLLFECKKIENSSKYIIATLANAVNGNGYNIGKIKIQERLKLIRFLMEDNKFVLPVDKLLHLIHEDAEYACIEINAYLHSHLPHLNNHRDILLTVASHGLEKLSIEELFNLFNSNIIQKGKSRDFEFTIHYQIQHRNISNDELRSLLSKNSQFKIDALFYYCNFQCKNDLSQLRMIKEIGIDINIENSRGEIALQYAMRQGNYNEITKFLIDSGSDIYKPNQSGESTYDILKSNKEFQAQLERVTKNAEQNRASKSPDNPMNNKIIESKIQKTLPIASRPINLGGKVEPILIIEFEKEIGQSYLEKIDASDSTINLSDMHENITGNLSSSQLKKQLESLLMNPCQNLVVCKINNQVGYGVFAASDIPKDTVLCFYSGKLINTTKVNIANDEAMGFYGLNASFSTNHYRGIASFFQHLPTALKFPNAKIFSQLLQSMGQNVSENDLKINDELYSVDFIDKNVEKSLALENIRHEYICYKGLPVVLFVTNTNIKAGEQLGFNYGKDYWLSRNLVPDFFDKSGAIIPPSSYKRTFYTLHLNDCTYIGELSPLIEKLKKGIVQIELKDVKGQIKIIDSKVLLDELLRVRGITEVQYRSFKKSFSNYQSGNSLFGANEIDELIKKYNLPDCSQSSLEKGLRNASSNNKIDNLKIFIKLVKNINAPDNNPKVQRTALHWAAINGHDACCQLLLEAGANPGIPDANNESALTYLKPSVVNRA